MALIPIHDGNSNRKNCNGNGKMSIMATGDGVHTVYDSNSNQKNWVFCCRCRRSVNKPYAAVCGLQPGFPLDLENLEKWEYTWKPGNIMEFWKI